MENIKLMAQYFLTCVGFGNLILSFFANPKDTGGALFKILHLGGIYGNYMIGIGLGVEAFLFFLTESSITTEITICSTMVRNMIPNTIFPNSAIS